MEKKSRYGAALLFIVSEALLFMDVFRIAIVDLSLADIVRIGLGKENLDVLEGAAAVLEEYMKPYSFAVIGLAAVIVICAVLTAVLKKGNGLRFGIAGIAAVNAYMAALIILLLSRFSEVESGLAFFGLEDVTGMYRLPAVLWVVVYVAALILCICGIRAADKEKELKIIPDILPESFRQKENPWTDHQDLTEIAGVRGDMVMGERDHSTENDKFGGAVLGLSGIYAGKAYELTERTPVYFCRDVRQIFLSERQEETVLAEVYFVGRYGEYCVTPRETKCCFLESGQPLGKNRHYYIPRGSKIYLESRKDSFELA